MMLDKKIRSFGYALKGISVAWREEFNFKFEAVCAVAALLLSWTLRISRVDFLIILAMIGLVLAAELFNTALEELCDKFQPTHDPHIAKIKDLAAAAVLLASLAALAAGCMIFIPPLLGIA